MSKDLEGFIKQNSTFLKIADGETVVMIYKGFSIIQDRFNPGKETVQYLFVDPDTNRTLPWAKSSTRIAVQMKAIPVDGKVSITRFGEGTNTTYKIIQLKESKPLGNVDPDEVPF